MLRSTSARKRDPALLEHLPVMQSTEEEEAEVKNRLKRSFEEMNSSNPEETTSDGSGQANQLIPRSYQVEIFEVASKKNTIAVLDTGTGKTMIAVMLIKKIQEDLKLNGSRKLIIFLAPTVHLVHQQFDYIKQQTNFQVGKFLGAMGVDEWKERVWEEELEKHDVLVMTPQILLDTLSKAYISLGMVSLVVIDECHQATGSHPYSRIMKEFYHKTSNRPKIFGMTASPVISKGPTLTLSCESQMQELENILDSKIYTVQDKTEMQVYVPSAPETCWFYDRIPLSTQDIQEKMEEAFSKFDASLLSLQGLDSCYQDIDDKLEALRKRLANEHGKIIHCLKDLGLICAYEAVTIYLEKASSKHKMDIWGKSSWQYKCYLEEVLHILVESLPMDYRNLQQHELGLDFVEAMKLGYVSPRIHELLQNFHSFGEAEEVLCLIFVERILTAKVIQRFLKKVKSLAHFSVSYATGCHTSVDSLAPTQQQQILDSFRAGKVNLLFTTDVLEEGIDVPNCSYVIRFDIPKTVRSYVQSRGRARKNNSQYILMLERGNMKKRDQLFDIIRSECSMKDAAMSRDTNTCTLKACNLEKTDAYVVEATGASLTASSSVSLIYRYCEKIHPDKNSSSKPEFQVSESGGCYQCALTLPPNAPLESHVGPLCRNTQLAKQQACFEACKKLHQMGALDNHLLPFSEELTEEKTSISKRKEAAAGAGTTKRKELHGRACVRALSGTWGEKIDGATLHSYHFSFSCSNPIIQYSGFVLLMESKLDDDVASLELDLYLVSKTVKATVSYSGLVHLNAEEMMKAKCFQEFFFNSLFGKLFVRSKSPGKPRKFLLQEETNSLWNPSYMYLLLPLENSAVPIEIKWSAMDSCVCALEFMKKRHSESENKGGMMSDDICTDSDNTTVHFANGVFDISQLKDKVVLAVHTGRIYYIHKVVGDTTAESPFELSGDETYAGYFNRKYGITLKYPAQPLLLLKHSHNPHNLLVDFYDVGGKISKGGTGVRKPYSNAHMPPELLHTLDIPLSTLKSFYLLPSLMYRIESLMLACQLRQDINCQANNFYISSSLVLEAITTLGCSENFSMERLELLGDSVLKYALSCHLFLKYPEQNEGKLSSQRSLVVCNATLHKRGTDCKIQGYIRDGAFEPHNWVAPGQNKIPVPCNCGIDSPEVPLEGNFHSLDPKIVLGKTCGKGHRWIISKTVADCVEALIGAYYVAGGLCGALHLMKWLGIDAEQEPSMIAEAINTASLWSYAPKADELSIVESKVGREFSVKGLLLEALTHPSCREREGLGYCYQRLEFLGDSVLDLLITWHLYQSYDNIDPGELTDLRSASVNNESFALAALRHKLEPHLHHCSALLPTQITEYVESYNGGDESRSMQAMKGPKALGDMVESIAGAVLLDSSLSVEKVWRVFKPLLSPLVTPGKLELSPYRELIELCGSLGYFPKEDNVKKGEIVFSKIQLQLKDDQLVGEGQGPCRKEAKGKAALHLLKQLEGFGIRQKKKDGSDNIADSKIGKSSCEIQMVDEEMPERQRREKKRKASTESSIEEDGAQPSADCSSMETDPSVLLVVGPIKMKKGGPRIALFELCQKLQWQMPKFDTTEHQSKTLTEFDDYGEKKTSYISFTSKISLHIPYEGALECTGDPRADKKASFDSAALALLSELEQQGRIVIAESYQGQFGKSHF